MAIYLHPFHSNVNSLTEAGFYSFFIPPVQWFSNISVCPGHLEGLLQPIAESHPPEFLIQQTWNGVCGLSNKSTYLTSSQVRMTLLV